MVVLTPAGARRTVSFSEQQPLGVCMQNAMTHAHTLTLTRTHTHTHAHTISRSLQFLRLAASL